MMAENPQFMNPNASIIPDY